MGDETRISRAIDEKIDLHAKFIELIQGQVRQTEKIDDLLERLDKLLDTIDNYPARTMTMMEDLKEKISGDTGLKVQMKEQHTEMRTTIRNWQLFAAAIITALSVLAHTLLKG